MRVTFLGTGTSTGVPVPACSCAVCRSDDPRDKRLRPSVLLQWDGASVLVDTSADLREQALRQGLRRVDAVLYTHAHADHILGLDELRLYGWRQGGPVPAYGSPRTLAALRRTFWYAFEDGEPRESSRPAIDLHEIEGPFDLLGRRVVPVPLRHGSLPIFGYRVGRFAYLTDVSDIPPSSHELLSGLDDLVLDGLRPRPHPTHFHIARAVEEAARIGARRTWLTHMSHDAPARDLAAMLPPGVRLAHDGLVLEVPETP